MPIPSVDWNHGALRVSENGRFLMHADGTPFFYLADTCWEMIHRLDRAEIDTFLADRAEKGFTAVQVVLIAEIEGLDEPNREGYLPLIDLDPARPNEDYFELVDWAIGRARDYGLALALLPTWGAYTLPEKHPLFHEHYIFNPGNAFAYARWLGARYGQRDNVLWVLGGDRIHTGYEAAVRAMARGLAAGRNGREDDYSGLLITYHPRGECHSAWYFHDEPWLRFNMIQSGHGRWLNPNYLDITSDYTRAIVKPTLDGEPNYENLPSGFVETGQRFTDYHVRRAAYWSLFAGACGHTYGCNEIWQCYAPPRQPILFTTAPWYDAIQFPGATQVGYARRLLERLPFFSRIPDQELLANPPAEMEAHQQACRDADGRYALVYTPLGGPVALRTAGLAGQRLRAAWFDPRSGKEQEIGQYERGGEVTFTPPEVGTDWVLVVESI